jgi:hypothetical protein
MTQLQLHLMPQEVNHLPVVAAVAPITDNGTPKDQEWVVVCHDARSDTYTTWRVYAQGHAVTGGYLADNGHYQMPYTRAIDDMMERAGLGPAGARLPNQRATEK